MTVVALDIVPRLSLEQRRRFKVLAREMLAAERTGNAVLVDAARAKCVDGLYVWGVLFAGVAEIADVYTAEGDEKSLARVAHLRAYLRAYVTDDAALDDDDLRLVRN